MTANTAGLVVHRIRAAGFGAPGNVVPRLLCRAALSVFVVLLLLFVPAAAQQSQRDKTSGSTTTTSPGGGSSTTATGSGSRTGGNNSGTRTPIGDGLTDDTAAIQAILDRRQIFYLQPFRTYFITRRLNITANGTGLVGDGTSTILMGSGSGEFDNTDMNSEVRYGTNAVGILAEGVSQPVLRGVRIEYEGRVDDRVVKAAAFRNCLNISVTDNDFSNFSKADGILYIGGTTGGSIMRNVFRDSLTNSTTWGQITGITFDDHDGGSTDIDVAQNTFRNLTVGRDFRTRFNVQTDGVNLGTRTQFIRVWENTFLNVGEGIDNFGQDIRIERNQITNAQLYGIKLVHGATRATVTNNVINDAGLGGIVISGSPVNPRDTADNVVSYNQIKRVNPWRVYDAWTTFGIGIMTHTGATYLARRNKIMNNTIDVGGTALFGIIAEQGSGSQNQVGANLVSNWTRAGYFIDPTSVPYLQQ